MQPIRSVSSYTGEPWATCAPRIMTEIPRIKGVGFDAIWLVVVWKEMCPRPLSDEDDMANVALLQQVLATLKANGMRAIIGLNYLGDGWSPEGITDPYRMYRHPDQYASFERYVARLMGHLEPWADVVSFLVFTEGNDIGRPPMEHPELARELRPTFGSLPSRMPPALRAKYLFGYHDCNIITLGTGGGESPVPTPCPYDFGSIVAYLSSSNAKALRKDLGNRKAQWEKLFPGLPLIVGEFGATSCPHNKKGERYQANVNDIVMRWILNNVGGFSLWGWFPGPKEVDCSNPVYNGLSITRFDGSFKLTADRIRKLLASRPEMADQSSDRKSWLDVVIGLFR